MEDTMAEAVDAGTCAPDAQEQPGYAIINEEPLVGGARSGG